MGGIIKEKKRYPVQKSGRDWALPLVSLAVTVVLVYIFLPGTEIDCMYFGDHGGYSVFPYFVEALAMFIVLLHPAKLFSRIFGVNSMFRVAGKHSLGILALHGSVATMMIAPFYDLPTGDWFPDAMDLVPSLIVAGASIVVSVAVRVLARKVSERKGTIHSASGNP